MHKGLRKWAKGHNSHIKSIFQTYIPSQFIFRQHSVLSPVEDFYGCICCNIIKQKPYSMLNDSCLAFGFNNWMSCFSLWCEFWCYFKIKITTKWQPTMPLLIDLWTAVLKPQVWRSVQNNPSAVCNRVTPTSSFSMSLLLHTERSHLRWFEHLCRMPPGLILGEVFWDVQLGGDTRADPGHAGEIMSLVWFWNASESRQKIWRRWRGRGTSGQPCLDCCPRDRDPDKQ